MRERILIIDREEVLSNLLQNFFLSAGYEVEEKGHRSISIILENTLTNKVDAALIDSTTLGESLAWFIDNLRTYHPDIVIIIMTAGSIMEQYKLAASHDSVYDVIAKPFAFREILMLVQIGLEEKRKGKEKRKRFLEEKEQPVNADIEKRKFYRVNREFPVMYCLYDYGATPPSSWEKSKTIDISPYGARLAIQQPVDFPSGKFCYLKISLPMDELFKTTGKIMWISDIKEDTEKHAGVQFSMIKDEEKNKIARCIYA